MSRILVVSYGVVPAPTRHAVELDNLLKALCGRYDVDAMTVRAGELPYVQTYRRARMLRVPASDEPIDGLHDLPAPEGWIRSFRRAVRRQLQGSDYDLIYVRDRYGGLAVCEASFVDAPVVYEAERLVAAEASPEAVDERFCLERADLVLARSQGLVDAVTARCPRAPVRLVEAGVDVDRFDWDQLPMPRVPRLVYHGAVAPGSGLRTLIDAVPLILKQRRVVVWIVGGGPRGYAEDLSGRAERLGVRKRIELFGPVAHDDLGRLLAMATLGIVPAIRPPGPCPNQLLEHAACRKPTVAPRHAEVRRLFGEACVATFAPGDASDLANVAGELLGDEARLSALAQRAYRRVRDRCAASAARRTILAAFLGLAPPFGLPRGMRASRSAPPIPSAVTTAPAPGTDLLPTIPNLQSMPAFDGES